VVSTVMRETRMRWEIWLVMFRVAPQIFSMCEWFVSINSKLCQSLVIILNEGAPHFSRVTEWDIVSEQRILRSVAEFSGRVLTWWCRFHMCGLRHILEGCSSFHFLKILTWTPVMGYFTLNSDGGFAQLYRASWYYQSLLFTNWCTIELL